MAAKSTKPALPYATPGLSQEQPGGIFGSLGWWFIAYIALLPLATLILSTDHEITQDRARFHVVNALTLTGFQSIKPISNFPPHAQVTVFVLTLLGILFALIVGGVCVRRILPIAMTERQIVLFACTTTLWIVVAGAIPLIAAHRSPANALMLSASSFGNSGLYIEPPDATAVGASPESLPGLLNWQTLLVLLPLAILGSLGLPVLVDLWNIVRRRGALSAHSRIALAFWAGGYLVFFFLFLAVSALVMQPHTWDEVLRIFASSSAESINARTLGMPLEQVRNLAAPLQWLLLAPMVIGGSAASTAGGIKGNTIYILFQGARRTLRGENPGKPFGIAVAWVGGYLAMVFLFLCLLIATSPETRADHLLFLTVSALSNVGLSHSSVQVVTPALDFLSAAMLTGRLAPLLILWWQARSAPDSAVAVG